MRTEQLEYLVDLAQTLSLTQTAEHFLTSHQVINNAIKNLETELNVTILTRTHRGIVFTPAGTLVCQYAQQALANRAALLSSLAPYAEQPPHTVKGELHIYTIPRFMNKYFLHFYNTYRKQNPKLTVFLKNATLSYLLDSVEMTDTSVILATLNSADLTSPQFAAKLQHLNLTATTLLAQSLGICVSVNSKYLELLLAMDNANLDSVTNTIPSVAFNYSADENMLFTSPTNTYYLIDSFEMQRQLIKSGNYIVFYTPFEYQQLFKNDSSLRFFPSTDAAHLFHYVALLTPDPQLQAQQFIARLQDFYQASP